LSCKLGLRLFKRVQLLLDNRPTVHLCCNL